MLPLVGNRTYDIFNSMYPKRYFQIQFDLANKMSEMKNIPLSEALFNYTMYYRRLGISGDRNVNNPEWISFVEIINFHDPVDAFYDLYTKRKLEAGEVISSRFGDFNYEIEDEVIERFSIPVAHSRLLFRLLCFDRILRLPNSK